MSISTASLGWAGAQKRVNGYNAATEAVVGHLRLSSLTLGLVKGRLSAIPSCKRHFCACLAPAVPGGKQLQFRENSYNFQRELILCTMGYDFDI